MGAKTDNGIDWYNFPDFVDGALILCGPDGKMRPDVEPVLRTIILEPDQPDARRQLRLLWADENARFDRLGAEKYAQTSVVQKLLSIYDKSAGQRYSEGLLALAFLVQMRPGGSKVRKGIAEDIVLKIIEKNATGNRAFLGTLEFSRGTYSSKDVTPVRNLRGIQRAHDRFRRFAHLLAADLIASSYLQPLRPIGRPAEYYWRYLSTAAYIEFHLSQSAASFFPDLVSVSRHMPIEARDASAFPLAQNVREIMVSGLSDQQFREFFDAPV